MIKGAPRDYPYACRAAQAIHRKHHFAFPLNVSLLLESIESHRIYDVSARTYNTSFAQSEAEMLRSKKAWTPLNEQLDTYLVVWNGDRSPAAIRYSVAHDLGHILLNHERAWPTPRERLIRDQERAAESFAR